MFAMRSSREQFAGCGAHGRVGLHLHRLIPLHDALVDRAELKGLEDVIVAAQIDGALDEVVPHQRRDGDDVRAVRQILLLDLCQHAEAVEPGHDHVQQKDIHRLAAQNVHDLQPVLRRAHDLDVFLVLKIGAEHFQHDRAVIRNKNLDLFHQKTPPHQSFSERFSHRPEKDTFRIHFSRHV